MRSSKVVDMLAIGVAFGVIASAGVFEPVQKTPDTPVASMSHETEASPEGVAGAEPFAFAPSWPLTLSDIAEPDNAAAPVPDTWPEEVVAAARARCETVLKGVAAVTLAEPPFRQGPCGAPAAVRLVSLGASPQVAVSPPALLTCDMVAALATWVERDLQPLARKHLGGEIAVIEAMSDYSCRTAYGRAKGRLSEHSRANALDIRGFRTSRGETATLLAGWGKTAREARTEVALGTLAPFVTTVEAAPPGAESPAEKAPEPPTAVAETARPTATASFWNDVLPADAASLGFGPADTDATPRREKSTPYGFSWLGGPRKQAPPEGKHQAAVPDKADAAPPRYAAFLRAAHRAACRVFGTVLGPEANAAHRNHFHVDLAARKSGGYCE